MGHGLIYEVVKSVYYASDGCVVLYGAVRWDILEDWLRENIVPPVLITRARNGVMIAARQCQQPLWGGAGCHEVLCEDGKLVNVCLLCTKLCNGAWGKCMPVMVAWPLLTRNVQPVCREGVNLAEIFTSPPIPVWHDVFSFSWENGGLQLDLHHPHGYIYCAAQFLATPLFRHGRRAVVSDEGPPVIYGYPAGRLVRVLSAHPALGWYRQAVASLRPNRAAVVLLSLKVAAVVIRHIAAEFAAERVPELGSMDMSAALAVPVSLSEEERAMAPAEYPDPLSILTHNDTDDYFVWKSCVTNGSTGDYYLAVLLTLLACDPAFHRLLAPRLLELRYHCGYLLNALYLLYHGVQGDTPDPCTYFIRPG